MFQRFFILSLVVMALVLALSGAAHAEHRREKAKAPGVDEALTLREAYEALHAADHDYAGHRHKAMEAIEAALKEMGHKIDGDGRGHEPQAESDAHLRRAHALLKSIETHHVHPRAVKHINHAMEELSIALQIK